MKKFLFLFAIAIPAVVCAQNFTYSKYDSDGKLTATYTGSDSRNYEFAKFYENGVKKESGFYKDGLKNGVWKTWSENGKLEARARYKEGMKTGKWTIWNEGEKQVFQINFEENNIKTAYKKNRNGHVLARR